MSLRLFKHLPFLSRSDHSVAQTKAQRALPRDVSRSDAKLWQGQLGKGAELLRRMNEIVDLSELRHDQQSVRSLHAPTTTVNRHTLLKTRLSDDVGGPRGQQLHASEIGGNVILMAVPRGGEAALWAKACLDHKVGLVVDLSGHGEMSVSASCMSCATPWRSGSLSASFADAPGQSAKPLQRPALNAVSPDARIAMLDVALKGPGLSVEPRRVALASVPVPGGQAISPRMLLETCRLIDDLKLPAGESVAIQCPDGGHRGALFAAANTLYRAFRDGKLDARSLQQEVLHTCVNLRANRDVNLFNEPEQLASLLSFGELMLKEDQRRMQPGNAHAVPMRSAMKGAALRPEGQARRQVRFADGHEERRFPVSTSMTPTSEAGRARTVPGTEFEA